jgi:FAD/FMN-containing dehydrogenase
VLQAPETPGLERWGALPSGFAIMKNVKNSFDPERRLNRGRFVGGL